MRKFVFGAIFVLAAGAVVAGVAYRMASANLAAGPMSVVFGCSQATTFIARTSGENTLGLQTLICGLVTDGIITGDLTSGGTKCGAPLDRFYILAMANSTDGLLDVCGNASAVANGSPTFTANAGFTGIDASSTVYLDTGVNPSTAGGHYTANSAHMMTWVLNNSQATTPGGTTIGQNGGAGVFAQVVPWWSSGTSTCFINQAAASNPTVGNSTGGWLCDRDTSSSSTFYRNGGVIGNNNSALATTLINSNIFILARSNGGSAESGGGYQVPAVTFGGHLTAAQVSSSGGLTGTGLIPRLCAYLTTVHGSC